MWKGIYHMLELQNIKKSFSLSQSRTSCVLNNINFFFPKNGLFFVLGKSGSGKSTLLNIISGILKPDEGDVIYNGKSLSSFSKKEKVDYLRNDVSIFFQNYNLFDDLTVEENLKVALSIKGEDDKEKIDNLLKTYDLIDKKKQKVKLLSGGEKQRVSFIRSIINDPKILLCDEPTGALDEKNSLKIFEYLKSISKKILVICVTHNLDLFNLYYDGFLKLENGQIKEKSAVKKETFNDEIKTPKKKRSFFFIRKIAEKNIIKNIKRNVISAFSTVFTVIILLISISLKNGINSSEKIMKDSYVDRNVFNVSIKIDEEIENSSLSLERKERPSENDLAQFLTEINCTVEPSFSYFFKEKKYVIIDDSTRIESFNAKPFFDVTLPINSMIVNREFQEEANENLLGKETSLFLKCNYSYISSKTNETINETLEIEVPFIIKEVRNEFSYMNDPKVYYQSDYLEKILGETLALNSSLDRNKNVSFLDLLNEAEDNSEISDYCRNIFVVDDKSREMLEQLIDSKNCKNLDIENYGLTLVNSFLAISDSIFKGANIFLGLSLITSLFITGFLAYSSSIQNRKESAILSSLGASKDEVIGVYLGEQMFFTVVGILTGTLLSFTLSFLINSKFSYFFVNPNIVSIDMIFLLFVCVAVFTLSLVTSYLSLIILKKSEISRELKEEWK